MHVFVVGKLGEVIKKVYELEESLREFPKNAILITELAAYNEILSLWPLEQPIDQEIKLFKYNLTLLKAREADLSNCTDSVFVGMYAAKYLKALNDVRSFMLQINNLGRHIGESPWMEITDAEHSRNDSPIASASDVERIP